MVYWQAENQKHKRTFVKKLLLLAPLITILISGLSPMWLQITSYNWWYMFLGPGFLTLICSLIERRDGDKVKYQALLSLPVSLGKVWKAKIVIAVIYFALGNIIFLACNLFGGFALFVAFDMPLAITVRQAVAGTFCMILVSLWEIPFCLWLSRKCSIFATIILNTGLGCILRILPAESSFWILCPYSWVPHLMIDLLGIQPNGEPVTTQGLEISFPMLLFTVLVSLIVFVILSLGTARNFEKRVVR